MNSSNHASERLVRLNEKIMHRWEERALAEVKSAGHHSSLVLRDSLPGFLKLLASALSTTVDRTKIRIKWDQEENTRVGQKHGRERAQSFSYTMDLLIVEYQILRQVICETMDEEVPLSPVEREVIICGVEQAVNDAATEFSETNRNFRQQMTDALAHDLRTPITAASLNAQIIIKKVGDADSCVRAAENISHSMDRMDSLIRDLLDASRLRAGEKLQLSFEKVDLHEILLRISLETNALFDNRIHFESPGQTIGQWNGNGLRRVFDNLISNALKFSQPKTKITLRLQQREGSAVITVRNFGEVISEGDKSILFKQFGRSRTAQGKVGWGPGLTVVKGITDVHGGRVEVESVADAGTTFRIVLPLSVSAEKLAI